MFKNFNVCTRVFVPDMPFQLSLKFVNKAVACQTEEPFRLVGGFICKYWACLEKVASDKHWLFKTVNVHYVLIKLECCP